MKPLHAFLKILFFTLLITCELTTSAQVKKSTKKDSVPIYYKHVFDYFKNNPPKSEKDSLEYAAFRYLLTFNTNDSIKHTISEIQKLIVENQAHHQIKYLQSFRKKIDSLNTVRNNFMHDYWERQRLQNIADTSNIASEDSLFADLLDAVFYQDTLNIDSIFETLSPYNDSLIESISKVIEHTKNNEITAWIKSIRRDTINFYVIDLESDSVLVRLYNNSPEMIKFAITDYWGNTVQAVLRDIDQNSFRILIDDTPELEYQTDEKAKKAFGGLSKMNRSKRKLTITPIPVDNYKPVWLLGGNVHIDLSQIQLSESWVKGGASSISFMTGVELFANFKKDNYTWENKSIFRYGSQRQGDYQDFRPTEDRLELYTKYGHKIFGDYFISSLSDFKSQFAKGKEYPNDSTTTLVSQFMSPGYLTFALGLDYKPNDRTTLFLSPLTSKSTFVLNDKIDRTKYGLDSSSNARHETGAIFKATLKNKIWGNIQLENQFEFFSNYITKPQNIDVDWDLKVIFPVNDFIRATISTKLIYDDDQLVPNFETIDGNRIQVGTTKAIQFKELLTIGFAMKF